MKNIKIILQVCVLTTLSMRVEATTSTAVLKSTYSVPVEARLASVATLDLSGVQFSETAGKMRLSYRLPPELVGPNGDLIELTQTNTVAAGDTMTPRQMTATISTPSATGEVAKASCSRHPLNTQKVLCMVVYHSLDTRTDDAMRYLNSNYDAFTTLGKRREVAAIFRNEPVGVLVVELN